MHNINDLKKLREFTIRGELFIEFVNLNTRDLFDYISGIIENKIEADIIEKIDGDWFRLNKYIKNNLEFQLSYDRDYGNCLKLFDNRDYSQDKTNYELLRLVAEEVADFIVHLPEKEYRVNEHIILQLKNQNTFIFIDNELFIKCLALYLIIPQDNDKHSKINSIDEANENFNIKQLGIKSEEIKLEPEEEFWGHCSNIQAWVENKYDTRLMHYNLAFPLLKKLTEAGDQFAKKVFKEEIAKRYKSGFPSVVRYLEEEGYLDYLSKEELEALK